jgi:hypothetical protein
LFLLPALALGAASPPPARGAWVEFDRRPAGWADSPFEFDSGRVRRAGDRVRAVYRYKFFYSGLPDPEYRVGIEIHCLRRRAFVYEHLVYSDLNRPPNRPVRLRTQTIATRIAPGSIEDSLARHLCPEALPGEE